MTNYSDKLKDPRWQKKRLEVLNRDNWTCRMCGSKEKTLHVHHIKYTAPDPWDEPFINLTTFCEDCHLLEKEFNDLVKEINNNVNGNKNYDLNESHQISDFLWEFFEAIFKYHKISKINDNNYPYVMSLLQDLIKWGE